ncbi:hypothetical protein HDV05_006051 [Chytridiales sp. JEL 0842]|nr:hypothetical protein HDV05_006051 [Chytridiales sp. JEL 0842]
MMMDSTATSNTQYASKDYWESRYRQEASKDIHAYEWLKGWDFYKEALMAVIPDKQVSILHLGCGNSELGPNMYREGFHFQENIDYSEAVIEDMRREYSESMPEMKWTVADIFQMSSTLGTNKYDVVIDKGTLDAFLTGWPDEDPWDPSEPCLQQCRDYMHQVEKVLKPDGVFIQITWSQPHFRRRFLECTGNMEVNVKKVGTDWEFFVFVCRLRGD